MPRNSMAKAVALAVAFCGSMFGQLNQNCTVSVLNRTIKVNADGSWVLPNIPANFGQVKARATCVQNGVTTFGESDFFTIPANGAVNLPDIKLGNATQIPAALSISPAPPVLSAIGQTFQLSVKAVFPDSSTKNVSTASSGTNYTTSKSAIVSITPDGLLTAVASGTVLVQASNDGATGIVSVRVLLSSADTDGDGIPDSAEISLGLDPRNAIDAQEDFDRDGLTNLREYQLGTDIRKADTDGDGLTDGAEVDTYKTNPLLFDTDGDGVPDGIEIQNGTNPNDPLDYDLSRALLSLSVSPSIFTITINSISPLAFQQLKVTGTLIDGKTTIDLTSTQRRTTYDSNNLSVCSFGSPDGRIFAGANGTCTITVRNSTFSAMAKGTVTSFSPTPLSFVDIPGYANNVDVAGNYAYVAAGAAGLQVVDVKNRATPFIAATLSIPGNANDVRVADGFAYLASGSGGLQIVDVSIPLQPTLKGSLPGGDAWDVAIKNGVAYIANGGGGLRIVNVSNPASPQLLGTLSLAGTAKGIDIDTARNLAVVAAGGSGLHVVNVANPVAPIRLSTLTGGDVRDVAVSGNFVFLADMSRSFTSVDFSNPSAPILRASTPQPLGGLLQDVAVIGNFALGADVFFVNGVPIVDISTPQSPVSRAILNFGGFRDDNATGVAADLSFVYLTAARDIAENGTTGTTRLYIGQYQQIVDPLGVPPTVQITSPVSGPLIQGSTITFSATAVDDVAVASVTLFVDGNPVFASVNGPYQRTYKVPANAATLKFDASALDYGNNIGIAPTISLPVIPDPLTSALGRVLNQSGTPISGAAVTAFGRFTTTASDGTFLLLNLPTVQGPIRVSASATDAGIQIFGISASVPAVLAGFTDVGDIQLGPKPFILSVVPASSLAGSSPTLAIAGANLNNAAFALAPGGPSVKTATVSSDGASAYLSIETTGSGVGTFAIVATTSAGDSGTSVVPHVNRFTLVDPNSNADSDGDGVPDVVEAYLGSDPLDKDDIPTVPAARETESTTFSILNAPVTGAGIRETESVTFSTLNAPVTGAGIRETESVTFSVLNAPVTGAGIRETEGVTFSVLNAPVTGAGITEMEGVTFSVLNAPVTGAGIRETESVTFSVLNSPVGTAGIREAGSYFSVLNNAVGVLLPKLSLASETTSDGATNANAQTTETMDPLTDSDGDGLPDWYEISLGTDPNQPDSDRDGLTDFEENFTYHTSPRRADTDGDGFSDGVEILLRSDPLNPQSTPLNLTRRAATVQPRPLLPLPLAANVRTPIIQR